MRPYSCIGTVRKYSIYSLTVVNMVLFKWRNHCIDVILYMYYKNNGIKKVTTLLDLHASPFLGHDNTMLILCDNHRGVKK